MLSSGPRAPAPQWNRILSVVSQGLNSASNLALAVAVARNSGATQLGIWSIGYAVFVIALTIVRAGVSTPVLLISDSELRQSPARVFGGYLGTAFMIASVMSTLLFASGIAIPDAGSIFSSFAIAMPTAFLQDGYRFIFFRQSRPQLAVVIDAAWLLLQLSAFAALTAHSSASPTMLTIAWGASAAAAAMIGAGICRSTTTSLRTIRAFYRRHRGPGLRLSAEALIVSASGNGPLLLIAPISGLAAAGTLRSGMTVMGLLYAALAGLTPIATLEIQHSIRIEPARTANLAIRWILLVTALGVLFGATVLLVPDHIGESIFGRSWRLAIPVLLAFVFDGSLRGPRFVVPIVLRASGQFNRIVWASAISAIPALAIPTAGSFVGGAVGAAWGIAGAMAIIDVFYLVIFLPTVSSRGRHAAH